jgi:hypothetical protein
VSKDIDEKAIGQFMTTAKSAQIRYPDVPKQIAHWLKQYPKISYQHLVDSTWSEVDFCHQTRQPEEASNAQVA